MATELATVVKAERAVIKFFDGLEIVGYRMPDGEFRVGLSGASRLLGYSERWLKDLLSGRTPRSAKALRELGFSEKTQKLLGQSNQGNDLEDTTINLTDFGRCITYAVQQKKKPAIALQEAFTHLALTDFFKEAFGEKPLTIEEKRQLFYQAYANSLNAEDWRQMDREDVEAFALPGDEAHLQFGIWNWIPAKGDVEYEF